MTRLIQNQSSTIVRERDRRRLRAMAAMLCLGCILVGAVLGYVWLQVQRVRVSYGIESLRASRTRLEEQNRKLQLEVASLRAFARVDSAARRLGLAPPGPDQVRLAREYLAPDGSGQSVSLRAAATDDLEKTGRP
jgi:cell division protein FtsL